jgi:predicted AlkP superfamily pyrophosphatase or phosphodiesterase
MAALSFPWRHHWLGLLALLLFDCTSAIAAEPAKSPHVILISVDGLAGFYLQESVAALPTLRRLAAQGALCTTMTPSFPSVTWPNHTTLATGVSPAIHGVLGNNVIDWHSGEEIKLIGDPRFDKTELVRAPTIYDAAHAAGLTTTTVLWPAARNAPTLTRTLPDCYSQERFEQFATRAWWDELKQAGVPVDSRGKWVDADQTMARCDWISTQAAVHAIEHHQPQLLLLHLLVCDSVQHLFGPRTPEAYWALSYADDCVRDVLEAVERAGLTHQTNVVIVSDHGFFAVNKVIQPNLALKLAGLLEMGEKEIKQKQAYVLSQGGAAGVYITNPAQAEELTPRLKELFEQLEGVERVFLPDQYAQLGQPTPREHPWAPQLWLAARDGYMFWSGVVGDQVVTDRAIPDGPSYRGMHGFLPEHADMRATFIASGPRVKSGVRIEHMSNLEVAPTLARLLGIPFTSAQGEPVAAALK